MDILLLALTTFSERMNRVCIVVLEEEDPEISLSLRFLRSPNERGNDVRFIHNDDDYYCCCVKLSLYCICHLWLMTKVFTNQYR